MNKSQHNSHIQRNSLNPHQQLSTASATLRTSHNQHNLPQPAAVTFTNFRDQHSPHNSWNQEKVSSSECGLILPVVYSYVVFLKCVLYFLGYISVEEEFESFEKLSFLFFWSSNLQFFFYLTMLFGHY